MHEAGIAASIIEIAEGVARKHGNARIGVVGLRLGQFTGVVREALEFAFEALRTDTLADRARLEIETVPLIGACPSCAWSGPPVEDFCLICPQCQTPVNIVSGREMRVEYVDLETAEIGEAHHGTCDCRNQSSAKERRAGRSQPSVF